MEVLAMKLVTSYWYYVVFLTVRRKDKQANTQGMLLRQGDMCANSGTVTEQWIIWKFFNVGGNRHSEF